MTITLNHDTLAIFARAFMLDASDAAFLDSMRATTTDDDDNSPLTTRNCDDFADACIPELRDDIDHAALYFLHIDATDAEHDAFCDDFSRITRELYDMLYDTMRDAARQRLAIIQSATH